jgi:hypothetical protein
MIDQTRGNGAMGMTRKIVSRLRRATLAGIVAGLALLTAVDKAQAQEILLTGPLAGAPAVRKLKLYRENRFEIAPTAAFTLLDEYQRQILIGARLQYNLTDWLAIGVWGASGAVKITTGLSEKIQTVNESRQADNATRSRIPPPAGPLGPTLNSQLTRNNIGQDFTKQLGTIDWVAAPQLTLVPFRGKIALFQSIYADTDLYFFGGAAFVGVKERADCGPKVTGGVATCSSSFDMASRMAIAPTFGLGFSFYMNKFMSFGFEWRGMPFARNTGGFDNHGGGPNGKFPDYSINEKDREFKFNQMLTVSLGFYLPTKYHVSE